jgi:O-methyltransferase involved in polyketide biosynthesis
MTTPPEPVNLTGIPETMLWTLHNRASEALRPDAILRDETALSLYRRIAYDYEKNFGRADGSHAIRSRVFDDAVKPWLAQNPGGTVVELACGLETQFQRCDDGKVRWLCIDLPEAIDVRRRLLPDTERCRSLAMSALDRAWFDEVASTQPVFITAQGLFMYLHEQDVQGLVHNVFERFPRLDLMFDAIPPWFSRKTMKGFRKTKHYQTPPMPWGVARGALGPLLRSWSPHIVAVEQVSWGYLRGLQGLVLPLASRLPLVREALPSVVRVRSAR